MHSMPSERTKRLYEEWEARGRPAVFDVPDTAQAEPALEGPLSPERLLPPIPYQRIRAHAMQSANGYRQGVAFAVGDQPIDPDETIWIGTNAAPVV